MLASSFPVIQSSESCAVSCDAAERASAIEAMVTIIDGLDLAGDDGLPACVGAVERFLRDVLNETGGAALGRYIEGLETARPTVERDGQAFTRVAMTPKTVMSVFGPVTYARRCRVAADYRDRQRPRRPCLTPTRITEHTASGRKISMLEDEGRRNILSTAAN